MIPVILIIIAWWASSGVVASIKAARASGPAPATAITRSGASATKASNTAATKGFPTPNARGALGPGDITFGQWQRSLYRRMQRRFRSRLPGQRGGKRVRDLIGDITAASIAGAAIFGVGFATGTAWAGTRRAQRSTRNRRKGSAGTDRKHARPNPTRPSTSGAGPKTGSERPTSPLPLRVGNAPNDGVIDAEITNDPNTYFEDVKHDNAPGLLAIYPTIPNGDPMSEILNIHHLLDYARTVIDAATDSADQATIRANSAGARADQAGNRSITAGNRATSAELVVANATAEATHLEQTAARFGSLNMDSASLTSITAAIESANAVAATERRRGEAEANVAACAAALAAAEEQAAAAAAESARITLAHVEVVKNMYDTVQARQMPHAEAQAATGNAAAHASLLAAN